jgi:hypothetical protein
MADTLKFYEHPSYAGRRADWERYADLTEGKQERLVKPDYLWPHEFEEVAPADGKAYTTQGAMKLRRIREKRSQYLNRVRPVLDRYVSILFVNEIDTEGVTALFDEEQIKDVDGEGTSLEDFIKDFARQYFQDGRVLALVDAPPVKPGSLAEEKALGVRPFLSILKALEVPDWDVETADPARRGKYNLMRTEYLMTEPRQSLLSEPTQSRYCKVFAKQGQTVEVVIYKAEGDSDRWQEISRGPVAMPELPISVLDTATSWINDVCPVALLRHNTQSSLDNGLQFQAHQRICAAGKFSKDDAWVMHEGVVTILPPDTTVTTIEPSDPIALDRRLKQLDVEILQTAFHKDRHMPVDSAAPQAEDAQREEKSDFLAAMKKAGRMIENAINAALRQWAAFKGAELGEGIKLNLDLTEEDIDREVQKLATLWDIAISKYPKWQKAELKKIARQGNLEDIDDIIAEIEAGPKEPEQPSREEILRQKLGMQEGKEDEKPPAEEQA